MISFIKSYKNKSLLYFKWSEKETEDYPGIRFDIKISNEYFRTIIADVCFEIEELKTFVSNCQALLNNHLNESARVSMNPYQIKFEIMLLDREDII